MSVTRAGCSRDTELARRELTFWSAVLKDIPSSRAAFVSPTVASPASADVIVAFDWNPAAGQHLVGIAVLSHGLYTIAKVPPWFLKRHPEMSPYGAAHKHIMCS